MESFSCVEGIDSDSLTSSLLTFYESSCPDVVYPSLLELEISSEPDPSSNLLFRPAFFLVPLLLFFLI